MQFLDESLGSGSNISQERRVDSIVKCHYQTKPPAVIELLTKDQINMDQGYTISPTTVETAQGEVVADFEIQGHPGGYDSHRPGYEGQEYFVDNEGQVRHQYENVDFDQLDEYKYQEPDLPGEYIQNIVEMFGGPNEYAMATAWARQNLSQDFIYEFNDALESCDVDQMQPMFEELLSLYHGEDNDEAFQDVQPFDPELQRDIFQAFGGADAYNEFTDWASENLSDEAIENYNLAMESGDQRLIIKAVNWLVEQRTG